jgi:hypothetical protein
MEITKCSYLEKKMNPFSSRLAAFLDLAKDRFFFKARNNEILIHFSGDEIPGLVAFYLGFFSLRQTSFCFLLHFSSKMSP